MNTFQLMTCGKAMNTYTTLNSFILASKWHACGFETVSIFKAVLSLTVRLCVYACACICSVHEYCCVLSCVHYACCAVCKYVCTFVCLFSCECVCAGAFVCVCALVCVRACVTLNYLFQLQL